MNPIKCKSELRFSSAYRKIPVAHLLTLLDDDWAGLISGSCTAVGYLNQSCLTLALASECSIRGYVNCSTFSII